MGLDLILVLSKLRLFRGSATGDSPLARLWQSLCEEGGEVK